MKFQAFPIPGLEFKSFWQLSKGFQSCFDKSFLSAHWELTCTAEKLHKYSLFVLTSASGFNLTMEILHYFPLFGWQSVTASWLQSSNLVCKLQMGMGKGGKEIKSGVTWREWSWTGKEIKLCYQSGSCQETWHLLGSSAAERVGREAGEERPWQYP